jgi:hypothetical protein
MLHVRFEVGNAPDAVLSKYHASVTRGAFGRGMTVEDFMSVPELSEMIESVIVTWTRERMLSVHIC